MFKTFMAAVLVLLAGMVSAQTIEVLQDGQVVAKLEVKDGTLLKIQGDKGEASKDGKSVHMTGNVRVADEHDQLVLTAQDIRLINK